MQKYKGKYFHIVLSIQCTVYMHWQLYVHELLPLFNNSETYYP